MTNYSEIYVSALVIILAQVLPMIGVTFDDAVLTTLAQQVVTIGLALWVAIRRWQSGDITVTGRKVKGKELQGY